MDGGTHKEQKGAKRKGKEGGKREKKKRTQQKEKKTYVGVRGRRLTSAGWLVGFSFFLSIYIHRSHYLNLSLVPSSSFFSSSSSFIHCLAASSSSSSSSTQVLSH